MNRSCTYSLQQPRISLETFLVSYLQMELDCGMSPETFIRVLCHPLGFRPAWEARYELGVMQVYDVPPIIEKEPLQLEDSRVWC